MSSSEQLPIPEINSNRPSLLDIIRIDETWVQIVAGTINGYAEGAYVKELNSKLTREIKWRDYTLTKQHLRRTIDVLQDSGKITLTPAELSHVYYDTDTSDSKLRKLVSVFGEYTRK